MKNENVVLEKNPYLAKPAEKFSANIAVIREVAEFVAGRNITRNVTFAVPITKRKVFVWQIERTDTHVLLMQESNRFLHWNHYDAPYEQIAELAVQWLTAEVKH